MKANIRKGKVNYWHSYKVYAGQDLYLLNLVGGGRAVGNLPAAIISPHVKSIYIP